MPHIPMRAGRQQAVQFFSFGETAINQTVEARMTDFLLWQNRGVPREAGSVLGLGD